MIHHPTSMLDAVIDGPSLRNTFRAELLELLKDLSYEEREVTLSSGRKSNFYIDCKQTVLTARGHFLAGWLMLQMLLEDEVRVHAVGGLTMGADPLVSAISTLSVLAPALPGLSQPTWPLQGFYVRKEAKKHGTSRWIEGAKWLDRANNKVSPIRVAIIEDVITTGGSAIKAISAAREAGFEVGEVIALVDREEDNGRQNLEKELGGESPLVRALFKQSDFR